MLAYAGSIAVLLLLPAELLVFAAIAPRLRSRFGMVGLVVVGLGLWLACGRPLFLASKFAPVGHGARIDLLSGVANYVAALGLAIIALQVRHTQPSSSTPEHPGAGRVAVTAGRALVVSAIVVIGFLVIVFVALSLMAP